MAQGYVEDVDVGENYFRMLLQRCFFQDVKLNDWGEIEWFKIHDLLHDIAEQVAGNEICKWGVKTLNVADKVRHLSLMEWYYTPHIFSKTHIRTFIFNYGVSVDQVKLAQSMTKWKCLRSLDLSRLRAKSLPETICELFHLRYLNLSDSSLAELPESFTKLVNLQTLVLRRSWLNKLPKDLRKLDDLSILDLEGCYNLSHMPMGLGSLTNLHTLGMFVVGQENVNGNHFDGLKCLRNLKGFLEIRINVSDDDTYVKEADGKYLITKEHLKSVHINFGKKGSMQYENMLLEDLQPHHDLKMLKLSGYEGETIPSWPKADDMSVTFHLPNLVSLEVNGCPSLRCLPPLANLPHLKDLTLCKLIVEYVVSDNITSFKRSHDGLFLLFPSLEELRIFCLPNLKGWWPRSKCGISNDGKDLVWDSTMCFPKLEELDIVECPSLTSIPICPNLERLSLKDIERTLEWNNELPAEVDVESPQGIHAKPKVLKLTSLKWLKWMPTKYLEQLTMIIICDEEVERLGQVKELFQDCILSSVQIVTIRYCYKLKSVGEWLEKLSGLVSLQIDYCYSLVWEDIPWCNLPKSLQYLGIETLEMGEVPDGIQYCTSLLSLQIWETENAEPMQKIESIPEWMTKLCNLSKFRIIGASEKLEERCKKDGEDWHLIQHIPLVFITTEYEYE